MLQICRIAAVVLLGTLLAGCPGGVRPPPPATPTPAPTVPVPTPKAPEVKGATLYTVDPAASDVNVLVYRGGLMARLGHNHVMTAKSVKGKVSLHPDLAKSGFDLSFPVAELIVDDAQARKSAGEDFPGEIPQKDRDGTRTNMLKPEVLDGERFAYIKLSSVKIAGSLQSARALTRITIKDVSREVEVPVTIVTTPTRVTATGQFAIKQTDFGIKPFSIGLGALEVVDQVQIRFKVVATR